jgi:sirohydrochlorin cobaltochelatase
MSVLPRERGPGEAVLLMAHGTRGRAREMYVDLGRELRARDGLVLIGSLEHGSGLAGVLPELRALGVGTVHLMPLLFSRGKHATRDMAGEGEHSWRSQLTRAGFACQAHVQGAGEKPALADIWLDHLREAVERLLA